MIQFETITDARGDVWCRGGVIRNLTATVEVQVGPDDGNFVFLGGSGLNLIFSGFPVDGPPNGVWRRLSANRWVAGDFILIRTDGAAEIQTADLVNVVATLATGAPVGSYASSTYGTAEFGAFTATAVAEFSAPGEWPDADLSVTAGTSPTGELTTTDGATYVLTGNTTWTAVLMVDGSAELRNGTEVIAIRDAGDPGDPSGIYVAVQAAQLAYNPAPDAVPSPPGEPDDDPTPVDIDPAATLDPTIEDDPEVIVPDDDTPDDDPPPAPAAPFGLLTIRAIWGESDYDLDTGISFLGATVGYSYGYSAPYMTHYGDDRSDGGVETIEVDLAAAFAAEAITDLASISVAADWYPPSSGSGPATIRATYENGDQSWEQEYPIAPQVRTPAQTLQLVLSIAAYNTEPEQKLQPWSANIQVRSRPAPEGHIYAVIQESSGTLSTASGPIFAATIPANTSTVFAVAIAQSTGTRIRQIQEGAIIWRDSPPSTGGGGGISIVTVTDGEYAELTEEEMEDPNVLYKVVPDPP